MKFVKEIGVAGVTIPKAVMKISNLDGAEKLELRTLENAAVLLKNRMTAMELIRVIESLNCLSSELLTELISACGRCVSCEEHCHFSQENRDIHLPKSLLEAADIPMDAKLRAEPDPDSGRIIVSAMETEYDLCDVPDDILDTLVECDVCLGTLGELLGSGDAVYGAY